MQTLQRQFFKDADLNRFNERVKTVVDGILASPILDGVLLENVVLTNTDTAVAHKLGRVPRGCFMVKGSTIVVWSATQQATDKLLYLLSTAANKTVSLWVF